MRTHFRYGAILAVASLALAGCGGSSSSGTDPAPPASDANLEHAQALIDQYSAVPAFEAPGPDIDAKSIADGKTIFSLLSTSTAAFMQATEDAFVKYGNLAGADVIRWPNQGQTSQWVQGMQTAIAKKVDAITLIDGTDPKLIMPQIVEAKEAGIPTIDVHDLDMSQPTPPNVAAFVSGHFSTAGELMAAWSITQTKGDANVLVITSNNYVNSQPVADGIDKEFKADCPSCKVTTVNVDGPDWATKIQPSVQNAITRDPGLNYILPVFDSMLTYVVPGVRAANATGRVKAASFNGSPAILDFVRDGEIVTMDVGENPAYIGAAGLDQTLRVMGGLPPSEDEHLVLRVFHSGNIEEAGVPAELGKGYGDEWESGFLKTWGLQ
jgi:ribose transport system substrate-binding protein